MNVLFRSLLVVVLTCSPMAIWAQKMAYVYIQGDKQTPFYVKLEGVMMERYGKNYFVLPQMEAGPANVEILFQQNTIPAQKFTILVPDGGSRGFLLTQYQGSYALYDLQQQFYLMAGNKAEDDHAPVFATKSQVPDSVTVEDIDPLPVAKEEPQPKIAKAPKVKKEKPTRVKKESPFKPSIKDTNLNADPQFINTIELNNDRSTDVVTKAKSAIDAGEVATDSNTIGTPKLAPTFQNSDCPQAINDADFEKLYKTMAEKKTDEDKVDFLGNQMDKCYLTWHARTLTSALTEDAARFVFLKKVYSRISDQQSFYLLDDLLRTDTWKAQFQELVHH